MSQCSAILHADYESEEFCGMLEWLKDGLPIADAGFAVLSGLIVAAVFIFRSFRRRWWQRRPAYVRKQQASILDQLGLGRPLETMEAVLGSPHILSRWTDQQENEERIYQLPGAWVVLRAPNGVVAAYSITVTDAELYYDTGKITRGLVPVCLGRSVFADATTVGATDTLEIYARMIAFHRYYDYGSTAGGRQFIWLAFNQEGAGDFDGASVGDWTEHTNGRERATACDLSRITVNTIAICGWELHDTMVNQGFYGPHPDHGH
ncbi:hypothetical protein D2E64_21745 [Mycobacteroides abscessus]|nr:hypothetical protein DDJ61_10990 [Mycobacteroides abscessus]PVA76657.1 hypothetical protein DDJ76_18820 [Mycobacteroides abscessus]RIR95524.1 hypothetical protein D2E50_03100 [Mycobacteroides abscessus]RIS15277.1 hypothetical protein D2E63_01085 [Mycobacteroides abscessus]RIS22860.1 hypothetical protein D2E69_01735 [Mycobacteroides abscessus]